MIIAILEWNSDTGIQPIVLVADDLVSARRAAVKAIAVHLPVSADIDAAGEDPDGEINDIDREWVRDNPLPALDDDTEVTAWLDVFKDQTTDLWLNLYAGSGTPDAEDFYVETRTATIDAFTDSVRAACLMTNGDYSDAEVERRG